jgi:type II secretory pathway pseudopilin PulG
MTEIQLYALATPLTVIVAAVMQNFSVRQAARIAKEAADKAEQVRINVVNEARVAHESRETIKDQLGQVHTLVNGRMTAALEQIATLQKQFSELFPHDKVAAARAEDASKAAADSAKIAAVVKGPSKTEK